MQDTGALVPGERRQPGRRPRDANIGNGESK